MLSLHNIICNSGSAIKDHPITTKLSAPLQSSSNINKSNLLALIDEILLSELLFDIERQVESKDINISIVHWPSSSSLLLLLPYTIYNQPDKLVFLFSPNQRILWNDAPKCDTWNVKLLKFLPEQVLIKYYGGSKLQWRKLGLKLSELHRHISPDTHTSYATFAHHACTDVDMTWEIFQYYMLHAPSELLAWTNQSGGKSVKSMFHIRKKE